MITVPLFARQRVMKMANVKAFIVDAYALSLVFKQSINISSSLMIKPYTCWYGLENLSALDENHDMPEHSNKPPCDTYEMPSYGTTRTTNSKVLLDMLDMMEQMMRMMQEISEELPLWKEDMSDVHNSDHENPCVLDNHDEIQPELVTEDQR
ncbi:hypothetical protein PVK06_007915 [Gossypium arboreum]|uniref:Uncharacterized protein n=1 Tax=Gossypium arboreum TaxID=29729 RepID=A0ABR0QIY4_GOSAR|nr:hypothetical protein PVK06_007915 [Gossypium arboreum]